MGWPRNSSSFPEPTWWNGDEDRDLGQEPELDVEHCPQCGEPRPHYADGMCEQCWCEAKYHGDCDGDAEL